MAIGPVQLLVLGRRTREPFDPVAIGLLAADEAKRLYALKRANTSPTTPNRGAGRDEHRGEASLGTRSEVGTLRLVIVHRLDLGTPPPARSR